MPDPEERQWKLRQLQYSRAFGGDKKRDRERKTANGYATDADNAGEAKVGSALRTRSARHQLCEELAVGGFMIRAFPQVVDHLTDMKTYVDEWPEHSSVLIQKRFDSEEAQSPQVIVARWDQFIRRVAYWPLEWDVADTAWDPLDPQLRFMPLALNKKVSLFLELFSEHLVCPIIKTKAQNAPELLRALALMQSSIDTAPSVDDENFDNVMEAVLSRVKGVAAMISREHQKLGGSKMDAEFVLSEGDAGTSSIYAALVADEDYAAIVSEYWRTIDHCNDGVPKLRKPTNQIKTAKLYDTIVPTLEGAVAEVSRVEPRIRSGQADDFKTALVLRTQHLAANIVENSTSKLGCCRRIKLSQHSSKRSRRMVRLRRLWLPMPSSATFRM